ncbi:hypothetical protein KC323_g132 [Hortaea werneckii]|nr:hypothetical protein KC323_g132 [Hortaea werneckii]
MVHISAACSPINGIELRLEGPSEFRPEACNIISSGGSCRNFGSQSQYYVAKIQVGMREYNGHIVRQATQFHECLSGIDVVDCCLATVEVGLTRGSHGV